MSVIRITAHDIRTTSHEIAIEQPSFHDMTHVHTAQASLLHHPWREHC